jgi:DNA-binding transcriptional LysR family regulator
VFTSPSYAGIVAAVKAGFGYSVLPRNMIPEHLKAITNSTLPKLANTHVCLLKQAKPSQAISSLESFVLKELV